MHVSENQEFVFAYFFGEPLQFFGRPGCFGGKTRKAVYQNDSGEKAIQEFSF